MEILFFAFVWCFLHQQIKKRLEWKALFVVQYLGKADCPKQKILYVFDIVFCVNDFKTKFTITAFTTIGMIFLLLF